MNRRPSSIRPLVGAFVVLFSIAVSVAGAEDGATPRGSQDSGREALSGTVTDAATGKPIPKVTVTAWEDGGNSSTFLTGPGGTYSFSLLRGTYFVTTTNSAGYVDELYENQECTFVQCRPSSGTPVRIAPGAPVSGIDFQLDRGATITGRVLDAVSGGPVPTTGGLILAASVGELKIKDARLSSSGTYVISGLPTGDYYVQTVFSDYRNELYNDVECVGQVGSERCDSTLATPISLTAPETVSGIDFVLARGGVISGVVVDRSDGRPIPRVPVRVIDRTLGGTLGSDTTDDSGAYSVGGLEAGTYSVLAVGPPIYTEELYDGIPCPEAFNGGGCEFEDGTPVEVALSSNTRVDFALSRLGTVSGTVRAADTGQPLRGVEVGFWDVNSSFRSVSTTDALGRYLSIGLYPRTYYLKTSNHPREYVDEVYRGIYCNDPKPRPCGLSTATTLTVPLETETSGIDFDLPVGGRITGRVTDQSSGAAIRNAFVIVWDELKRIVTIELVDDAGTYVASGLTAGKYFVQTSVLAYVDEVYDDLPCGEECDPRTGVPIDVELGATSAGIDFSLERLRTISGRITDQDTGLPVAGASVVIDDPAGEFVSRSSQSDAQGRYVAEGIGPGTYFAIADAEGYVKELFDGLTCPGPTVSSCDLSQGTPIRVGTLDVTGINFDLEPESCSPLHGRLCLNQGRFRVEVKWQDGKGHSGFGHPSGLTDDSGYFWFFDQTNVEVVVKVLDGCFAPFDTFWVFAAGLTNVETEITVTDLATDTVKRYRNPQGRAFEPIFDTGAFSTCDAAVPDLAGSAAAAHDLVEPDPARARRASSGAALQKKSCPDNELCLYNGRYVVEAFWRTPSGQTGVGHAELLYFDLGYFWFFGPDNVEVMVKVLDACKLDPFNKYWFFAAGLTSVEVTLRVTDVITGKVAEYSNRQGVPFRPIQDTVTFDTCP